MAPAILIGTALFLIAVLLRLAIPHLRESVGPWANDGHDYDDPRPHHG